MRLLWAGFCFIVLVSGIPHHKCPTTTCNTRACKNFVREMKMKMNTYVSPCKNFTDYACGSFLKEDNPMSIGFIAYWKKTLNLIKVILNEPIQHKSKDSYEEKIKTVYKTCMKGDSIQKTEDEEFECSIKEMWPTLNRDWNSSSFNLQELINGNPRTPGLFHMRLYEDERDPEFKQILRIKPLYSDKLRISRLLDALQKYYVELAMDLGAEKEVAECHADDVMNFIQDMLKIDSKSKGTFTTLEDMNKDFPYIDWLEYIKTLYKDVLNVGIEIKPDQAVKLDSAEYFQNLSSVLQNTDKETVQNFYGFVQTHKKVGSMKRVIELWRGNKSRARTATTNETRSNYCAETIVSSFNTGLAKLMLKHLSISQKAFEKIVDTAKTLITHMKVQFSVSMQEQDWMNKSNVFKQYLKMRNMSNYFAFPTENFDDETLDKYYKDFDASSDYECKNSIQRWKKNIEDLNKPLSNWKNTWMFASFRPDVEEKYNRLNFDIAHLIPPIFDSNLPTYLNFAFFGHIVARGLRYVLYDSDPKATQVYKEKLNCFVNQNISTEPVTASILGLELDYSQAFRAYKKYSEDHPDELLLPKVNMTKDQLFFITSAQAMCGRMSYSMKKYPNDIEINTVIRNRKEFAEAFNCKAGDDMNPEERCHAWDEEC